MSKVVANIHQAKETQRYTDLKMGGWAEYNRKDLSGYAEPHQGVVYKDSEHNLIFMPYTVGGRDYAKMWVVSPQEAAKYHGDNEITYKKIETPDILITSRYKAD